MFRGGLTVLMDQNWRYEFDAFDQKVFDRMLPAEHPLIDAEELIPWESFAPMLEEYYSRDRGQPAVSPILMLKLEYLRYQYDLSDRQVMERSETDIVFRWFLQIPIRFRLPDASLLTKFRGRLGSDGFKKVFTELVKAARRAGLIKDRLRLKDASHVIANIAVPTTIKLFAQLRDRLLEQLAVFDPEAALGFRVAADSLRAATKDQDAGVRLEGRVKLLEDILHCVSVLVAPPDATGNRAWQSLCELRQIGEKVLYDHANPDAGHKTLSVFDSEARRGKHGEWYDGYTVDVMMDADSELITALQVLEAGGDEAKSCVELVRCEQEAHGNKIGEISMDGAGCNGEMLRTFEKDMGIEVVTPPKQVPPNDVFPNTEFKLAPDGSNVTCPAGQQSSYRQRHSRGRGTIYRFKRSQCDGCPLVKQCMPKPGSGLFGRSVSKNDYEEEYARARAKAQTEHYAAVRREHPAIERKLNELMNHHGGRRARYWGRAKVAAQQYMTAFTVNIKRMVSLLTLEACAVAA
jgi:transposase